MPVVPLNKLRLKVLCLKRDCMGRINHFLVVTIEMFINKVSSNEGNVTE